MVKSKVVKPSFFKRVAKAFKKENRGRTLFIILMLAYPILQFALFWGYVNIGTIILTFQKFSWNTGKYIFNGFNNYKQVFIKLFTDKMTQQMMINSLLYMPVTCFIILPLSMIFSYFLYKKVPLSGVFRVIYFLPSILPIVVLTMVFSFVFDPRLGPANSIVQGIFNIFGSKQLIPSWFGSYPTNQIMIYVYCIWAGLGFNILLLTGAIQRIPREVIEFGELEGISFFQEFKHVIVPMIWPTVTTTFILGITSVFTVMMQPMLLTPGNPDTNTISLMIYNSVIRDDNIAYTATFGILISLIGLPVILLIKKGMNNLYKGVDY
jgi:ABC-type sugar transport system permease subunit